MNLTPFFQRLFQSDFVIRYHTRSRSADPEAAMSRRVLLRYASAYLVAFAATTQAQAATYARTYLVNDLILPTTNSESTAYAIDVDGDNQVDNRFGQILVALAGSGMDLTGATGVAVASGSIVHLVHLQTTDASFVNDPAAQATWCVGKPMSAPPAFDGLDNASCFTTSGVFTAALAGGNFTSPSPVTTPNPVSLDFTMALGTEVVTLAVLNARLSFNADGSAGQINGSIPHDEITYKFDPTFALMCNDAIQNAPTSDLAMQCKSLFDKGCSGSPDFADDGWIEVCEIIESSLFQSVFAPDVMVDNGGTPIEAISVGFGFTAVVNERVFANGFEP
jgi:hypothetical protein